MQDLLDLISDPVQWKRVEPLVQQTFIKIGDLFQKFNNKLAFIENTIYNKEGESVPPQLDSKTVFKSPRVRWKSPLKETIPSKVKPRCPQMAKNKSKKVREVFPQQLYLQSNETMFSMVIEEIQKLKCSKKNQKSKRNQFQIQRVHQDYSKLERKQLELEQQMLTLVTFVNESLHSSTKANVGISVQPPSLYVPPSFPQSPPTPSMHVDFTMKLFELQKLLVSKPSLQTVLQLTQQHISEITHTVEDLQEYTQTNLTSINRILNHQSSINLEVCREMKVGKWIWQGRETTKLTLVPWEKQIVNLFPECVVWNQKSTTILIKQSGFYKIDLCVIGDNSTLGIIINDDSSLFRKDESMTFSNQYSDIIEATANSHLSVSSENEMTTIIMILQKIA